MLPLLRFAADGQVHTMSEAREALAAEFKLTDEQLRVPLADYMIDFGIGVTTRTAYELKRLDSDYFEGDV